MTSLGSCRSCEKYPEAKGLTWSTTTSLSALVRVRGMAHPWLQNVSTLLQACITLSGDVEAGFAFILTPKRSLHVRTEWILVPRPWLEQAPSGFRLSSPASVIPRLLSPGWLDDGKIGGPHTALGALGTAGVCLSDVPTKSFRDPCKAD